MQQRSLDGRRIELVSHAIPSRGNYQRAKVKGQRAKGRVGVSTDKNSKCSIS